MQEQQLRERIAHNIGWYRRNAGQTQSELAQAINYSDKSVSKWERGEGTPDIYVLYSIAQLYGVTVNDLISVEEPKPPKKEKHILQLTLMCGLVWLIGTVTFYVLHLAAPQLTRAWLCFVYPLPACAILGVIFTKRWWGGWPYRIACSLLIWMVALSVHLTVSIPGIALLYIVGGVLQVLLLLWYRLQERMKKG